MLLIFVAFHNKERDPFLCPRGAATMIQVTRNNINFQFSLELVIRRIHVQKYIFFTTLSDETFSILTNF